MVGSKHGSEAPLSALLTASPAGPTAFRRRGTYRVHAPELHRLTAQVDVDGTRVPVELLDLSARGAGLRADSEGRAALEQAAGAGASTRMTLVVALPDRPEVSLSAEAVQANPGGGGLRLGVRLSLADREHLESSMLPLFNQRQALRVTADPQAPMSVQISAEDGERLASARLFDVSMSGMGLTVEPGDASRLAPGQSVRLRFVVPGSPEPVRLGGVVRHIRAVAGTGHLAGLALRPDHPDEAHARTRLGAYLVRRQLQMRRRAELSDH